MNPKIFEWARRHGVSSDALDELKRIFVEPVSQPMMSYKGVAESAVSSQVRLEASNKGCILWRNNVGAAQDRSGRMIFYGLAHESQAMSKVIKSSDLIGIRPLLITPDMVGCTVGQFIAREVKKGDWVFSGKGREEQQLRFLEVCVGLGADACFVNNVGSI